MRVPKMTSGQLIKKYMDRQLTLSAVLATEAGENPAVLLDIRYKMDLLCHRATVQITDEFNILGDYERGTRICFMATIAQGKEPITGCKQYRLHRFHRACIVP